MANEKEFSERSNSLDETYRRIYDYNQVNEMIKGYTSVNSNIKISYIDLIKTLTLQINMKSRLIHIRLLLNLTKTKRYRVLDYLDFLLLVRIAMAILLRLALLLKKLLLQLLCMLLMKT